MITNLFSIFDPTTSQVSAINWLIIFFCLVLTPTIYWITPRYITERINILSDYLLKEFKPLIKKQPQVLIFSVSIFIFILINNLPGLLPAIFTASSHISLTLTLALPIWIAIIIQRWFINTKNTLIHLIPNGTPTILIPFIVLIETVRNIIRPLTLSIRLTANIIAGHLLITLIAETRQGLSVALSPFRDTAHNALAFLEIAVAFIQAYVFRVLITLYISERI